MSDDEELIRFVCVVLSLFFWGRWYFLMGALDSVYQAKKQKIVLAVAPLICMLGVFYVLSTLASYDVVSDMTYKIFYLIFAAAWLGVGILSLPLLGIFWRDDALERKNNAQLILVISAMAGMSFCYAGANIGDGPGWWCVLIAGGMAHMIWFLMAFIIFFQTGVYEKTSIERNISVGIRMGGYLIASGLVCGRGAAGDWISFEQTVKDFVVIAPVMWIAAGAIFTELLLKNNNAEESNQSLPKIGFSTVIAITYIALSLMVLHKAPPMPQNPQYKITLEK